MNSLHKSLLSLSVVVVSGWKLSNPTLAQLTPLQMFQQQCAQNNQYACIQYQQMLNRGNQARRDRAIMYERWVEDIRDNGRMNRRAACRNYSYDFNDLCDYTN